MGETVVVILAFLQYTGFSRGWGMVTSEPHHKTTAVLPMQKQQKCSNCEADQCLCLPYMDQSLSFLNLKAPR